MPGAEGGDQGSVGFSALLFLREYAGLGCTFVWDISHRLQNDWSSAFASAGLLLIKFEHLQACKLRQGPWDNQGDFWTLRGAAREFFSLYVQPSLLFVSDSVRGAGCGGEHATLLGLRVRGPPGEVVELLQGPAAEQGELREHQNQQVVVMGAEEPSCPINSLE